MKFATMTLDKLPAREAFGRKEIYKPDDVAAAIATLKTHVAVSNGEDYEDRKKAGNAAGTLRARIKKMDATLGASTYTQIVPVVIKKTGHEDRTLYRWWIVPPPATT